jgi:hypothetical protein
MDTDIGSAPVRSRLWLRLALAVLAIEMVVIGGPAAFAPEWFFRSFPFGRGWVASTGAYNEHSMLDLGYVYIAFGVVMVWAAVRLSPELTRAALAGALVANVPHLIFHLSHTRQLPLADDVAQSLLLAVPTAVNLAALLLTLRRPAPSRSPGR